jgi:hypothetical protein
MTWIIEVLPGQFLMPRRDGQPGVSLTSNKPEAIHYSDFDRASQVALDLGLTDAKILRID